MSLAETKDFGIARIIVDDVFEAVNILKDADFVAKLTSVLAVKIPDVPGGLDQLLSIFSEAEVNIEYMYAFLGGSDVKSAYMIFRVADTKGADCTCFALFIDLLFRNIDLHRIFYKKKRSKSTIRMRFC